MQFTKTPLIVVITALTLVILATASAFPRNQEAVLQPPASSIPCTDLVPATSALDLHDSTDATRALQEILGPAVSLIEALASYVAHHPWILLGVLIPALELWIPLVGFGVDGVVTGSIAAAIQSSIGNVPQDSVFAFLQSYGGKGFARQAVRMAGMWVALALVVVAVGKLLLDNGVEMGKVVGILEGVWNRTVEEGPAGYIEAGL